VRRERVITNSTSSSSRIESIRQPSSRAQPTERLIIPPRIEA
jgi:hypothetical protein